MCAIVGGTRDCAFDRITNEAARKNNIKKLPLNMFIHLINVYYRNNTLNA